MCERRGRGEGLPLNECREVVHVVRRHCYNLDSFDCDLLLGVIAIKPSDLNS